MSSEIINGIFAVSGGIVGAILTAILTRYFAKKSEERKELTLLSSIPSRLIEISDKISAEVEIKVNGKPVNKVYMNELTIMNSGNQTLYDLDIRAEIFGSAEILSAENERANFNLESSEFELTVIDSKNAQFKIKYLNPGDELNGALLLTDKPEKVVPKFRQPEVKAIIKTEYIPEVSNVLIEALFQTISSNFLLHSYMKMVLPTYRRYLDAQEIRRKQQKK